MCTTAHIRERRDLALLLAILSSVLVITVGVKILLAGNNDAAGHSTTVLLIFLLNLPLLLRLCGGEVGSNLLADTAVSESEKSLKDIGIYEGLLYRIESYGEILAVFRDHSSPSKGLMQYFNINQ